MNQIQMIPTRSKQSELSNFLSVKKANEARSFHKSLKAYETTPLVSLPHLAQKLRVKSIYVKDESYRFGLNAFKGLGSSYAIHKLLGVNIGDRNPVFVTATDGNHGRGVAWASSVLGGRAIVFMPKGSQECRANAIQAINSAIVEITDLNYDDTVRHANQYAKDNGHYLVQDTAFEGYEEIPNYIAQGYTTMVSETLEQMESFNCRKPTHMFLQAGVGSMAGAVLGYMADYFQGNPPATIIAEPEEAACIYESVLAGKPISIGGNPVTSMAGLNCGEPSITTWPVLRDYASFCTKCPDWVTESGMRILAHPLGGDPPVVSGESGAVGVGLLYALCTKVEYEHYRQQLGLNQGSEILLFSTEGDTDPENYQKVLEDKSHES